MPFKKINGNFRLFKALPLHVFMRAACAAFFTDRWLSPSVSAPKDHFNCRIIFSMATPGPVTRSRTRAEAASELTFPTTTNVAKTSKINDETKLTKQTSLIPAYHFDDSIEDLSLERMLGTPFPTTCQPDLDHADQEQQTFPASPEQLIFHCEVSSTAPTPFVTPATVYQRKQQQRRRRGHTTTNKKNENKDKEGGEEDHHDDDNNDDHDDNDSTKSSPSFEHELISALHSLALQTADHPDHPAPTNHLTLRGLPSPKGQHIRFKEVEEQTQPLALRGLPSPKGNHIFFD